MHKKHVLLMLACCLIPIAGIAVIGALAIPVAGIAQVALALVCPLMMLLMMLTMRDHGQHEQAVTPAEKDEPN